MFACGGRPPGPLDHQYAELSEITDAMVARAHAAGVVRADLRGSDMPPLYAGLASVVLAGVADWRRYVALLLDGLRPR